MADNSKIDPSEFIVPPTDTRGRSDRASFRIQIGHLSALDRAVSSGKFSYRTRGDLLRHAVKRHLDYLDTIAGRIDSARSIADAIIATVREEEYQRDFMATFDAISKLVEGHLASGAKNEAKRVLRMLKFLIRKIPENYWKGRYDEEFEKRFGYLDQEAVSETEAPPETGTPPEEAPPDEGLSG